MARGRPLPRAVPPSASTLTSTHTSTLTSTLTSSSSSPRRLSFLIFNLLALTAFVQPVMSQGWVNAVYYPNWRVYKGQTPASMPVNAVTHVMYAFIKVNTDGSLKLIDDWADTQIPVDGTKGCLSATAKLKASKPSIRTLVSVGGGTGSAEFPALAANPTARARFAKEIKAFCDKWQLNGVDIDWEHPSDAKQGKDYISLLSDVRQQMPAGKYLITSALPPGQWVLKNIDLRRAASLLDYLNLMCYDLTGPWTDVSGNHAQLLASKTLVSNNPNLKIACADGITYVTSNGFPSRKVLLGIPAYARTFPNAKGPGGSTKGSAEVDYCDMSNDSVDKATVDTTAAAATYIDPKYGFMTFDVPRSVAIKAQYAKSKALGGLFYWTGVGDRKGRQSLVQAGFNELNGIK
ncbi:glycosyl hydrolase family 18 [Colletotrichum costaricense]|uniref:chitinase n=2 Tax=Colletotrichum acutatum species complex TaxID=2707335 RepID=A0AAI9Z6L7_9PEZI|nr:glycosyl hydrolase family 18 [Colletotrichum costaricense]XP_060376306.1 glycosyl hydrolase family 18 [Colletotrichum tamarilloi]KAK1484065.1 glycosyl hydrolase family 18 [Colletotrichum tamarilloi]KAK1536421.1 glycosyl hydrolase family 18 [Colletotrichum costaricense]